MKRLAIMIICCALVGNGLRTANGERPAKNLTRKDWVKLMMKEMQPLKYPRGKRLPLYVWRINNPALPDDAESETMLRELDRRGIGVLACWSPRNRERTLADCLRIGKLQHKLGLEVAVVAHTCLHYFFNGDPSTFHVAANGEKFCDTSFVASRQIGCPFAAGHRYPPIRAQIEYFAKGYGQAGVPIAISFADWEVDGPIEWNDGWANCKKCTRCRENIPDIDDFTAFQKALRTIRCEMQRECYAEPLKTLFPDVLVGNYAVNPHGGHRYWYDFFEKLPEGAPYLADQRARYRQWFHEFPLTGYTYANPVAYTWYDIFNWYDFDNPDYRWFYNLLLVASNACEHTPRDVPVITWLHWHTTAPPPKPDPDVRQFSEEKYQEVIWHMLLRGTDGFSIYARTKNLPKEIPLVQEVYAASLEYKDFLDKGEPITFHVPKKQGPVVSGLKLGKRILIRRTDFDDTKTPVQIKVNGKVLHVPRAEGQCQIIALD